MNVLMVVLVGGILAGFTVSSDQSLLIGTWVYDGYENDAYVYVRANKFDPNKSGIEFKSNGHLTKRQNVGWCGTPPVTYGNYKGSWSQVTNESITIRYKYWGGEAEQDWKIVGLTDQMLKIVSTDYRTGKEKMK